MGGAAPLLVQFGPEGEGARGPPWPPLSLSTRAHKAHYIYRGGSGNPPALRFFSEITRNTSGVRI